MKFLGNGLLFLACILIAIVDGRQEHGKDTGYGSRREFPRPNMKRHQQARKANVADEEVVNSTATSKQDEAKPNAVRNNDAEGRPAGKEKRGHKSLNEARHIGRDDEFKRHNHHHHVFNEEAFHKRHHENRKRNHPNYSRVTKKGKMSREMMLEMDMPKSKNAELKHMRKRMMKMAKHKEEKRERQRNHSLEKGPKGKAP